MARSIETAYLQRKVKKGERWAMTALAMLYLKGMAVPRTFPNGKTLLLLAGHSYDRLAACRLALYYHSGRYGFPKDEDKAIRWRDSATRWLASDASLIYDDSELAMRAKKRYAKWQTICEQIWGGCINE